MLKFQVQGSGKTPYTITAEGEGQNFVMYCTCPAGRKGQRFCKHRRGLLYGDVTKLVEGSEHITQLHDMAKGSIYMAEADNRPLPAVKAIPPDGVKCIKSLAQIGAKRFCDTGYHTDFTEGFDPWEQQSFKLFSYFKNGNKRKQPDFEISWERSTGDSVVQYDGSIAIENIRERSRPYIVRGKGGATITTRASFADAYDALIKAIPNANI